MAEQSIQKQRASIQIKLSSEMEFAIYDINANLLLLEVSWHTSPL